MKKSKKMIFMLLTGLLVLMLGSFTCQADANVNLNIFGKAMVKDGAVVGTFPQGMSYDPATNTLTLDSYTAVCSVTDEECVEARSKDWNCDLSACIHYYGSELPALNVVLKGESVIETRTPGPNWGTKGIFSQGDLNVFGPGSLTLKGNSMGALITANTGTPENANLSVSGATLKFDALRGMGVPFFVTGNANVKDSTISITADYGKCIINRAGMMEVFSKLSVENSDIQMTAKVGNYKGARAVDSSEGMDFKNSNISIKGENGTLLTGIALGTGDVLTLDKTKITITGTEVAMVVPGTVITKNSHRYFMGGKETTKTSFCKNYDSICETKNQDVKIIPGTKPAPVKVKRITLSAASRSIAAGKRVTVKASVYPSNAANKGLVWKTNSTRLAMVTQSGVVTLKRASAGRTVLITATAKDGSKVKGSIRIASKKGIVKAIRITGDKSVRVGKTIRLRARVSATTGANRKLLWSSSNKRYATVTQSGTVKGLRAGRGKYVTITARATDGSGKKATFRVKVR